MIAVSQWTGHEARLLRQALRMSVRGFADFLGVSARTVSKWEAGGTQLTPRPDTQAILDTALQWAPQETRERFERSLRPGPPAWNTPATSPRGGDTSSVFVHPVDGKQMTLIPAPDTAQGSDGPPPPTLTFLIDVTPVTNDEYHQFVVQTGHRRPPPWNDAAFLPNRADHPVTHVTHADATAYAAWATKLLPSIEEWETAARGPERHTYPWGDHPTAMKCNVRESMIGDTTPVRQFHSGISGYGVYDLAGNVWEWCRTSTSRGRYALKGSAFTSPLAMSAATQTNDAYANMLDDDTGFRCVAAPSDLVASPRSEASTT